MILNRIREVKKATAILDDILGGIRPSVPDDLSKPKPQCKYADQEGAVWAHLHSSNLNVKNVELRNKRISIGRLPMPHN